MMSQEVKDSRSCCSLKRSMKHDCMSLVVADAIGMRHALLAGHHLGLDASLLQRHAQKEHQRKHVTPLYAYTGVGE